MKDLFFNISNNILKIDNILNYKGGKNVFPNKI
jgi:hypothetical protein